LVLASFYYSISGFVVFMECGKTQRKTTKKG